MGKAVHPSLHPPPTHDIWGGEGEGEQHVLQGGKAGIFLKRTPTESIFKFPVLIFRTPAGSSQPGVGGGGDHQRSLIPARGGGTDLPTQNNLSTCKPSPSLMWGGGG
jgi:hypothetical protein